MEKDEKTIRLQAKRELEGDEVDKDNREGKSTHPVVEQVVYE